MGNFEKPLFCKNADASAIRHEEVSNRRNNYTKSGEEDKGGGAKRTHKQTTRKTVELTAEVTTWGEEGKKIWQKAERMSDAQTRVVEERCSTNSLILGRLLVATPSRKVNTEGHGEAGEENLPGIPRNLGDDNIKRRSQCENLVPFYFNAPQYWNMSGDINISDYYSLRWDVNYIYFEKVNHKTFVNFNLYSIYVKNVELYEHRDRNIMILRREVMEGEVKFVHFIDQDVSLHTLEKRIFYFIIRLKKPLHDDTCVKVGLDVNIGKAPITSFEDGMVVHQEKKSKRPLHHKSYIIIRENYYYASNDDFYFTPEDSENDTYIDDNGAKFVIVYSVLLFPQFDKKCNISFFSFLNGEITKKKNFSMQLRKIMLNNNYFHNMNIDSVLKHTYNNMTCSEKCVKSIFTKNGLLIHNLLENNYMYKFEIVYKLTENLNKDQGNYENNTVNGWTYNINSKTYFNMEFSVVMSLKDQSFIDYVKEYFNSECIHNSFFVKKIVQIGIYKGRNDNVISSFSMKKCQEKDKHRCNFTELNNEYVIYGRIIQLNDSYVLNFDPINLFREEEKVHIHISEDSLFNFTLTTTLENIYVNLLKGNSTQNVCNTYYLHHINEYNIFSFQSKDKAPFMHYHFNTTFGDKKKYSKDHRLKKFSLQNVVYINCVLPKGEYDLRIVMNDYISICQPNDVQLTIFPLHIYEERHTCGREMHVLTDLIYYHLRGEGRRGGSSGEGNRPIKNELTEPSSEQSRTISHNVYETMWELNNPLFENFDFVVLHENIIDEEVDEIVVTVNTSAFVDIFLVITESVGEESYYYVYKNSRGVAKYGLKFGGPFHMYLLAPSLHYEDRKICGFFFVDVDLVLLGKKAKGKTPRREDHTVGEETLSSVDEPQGRNVVQRTIHLPELIIGYDTYAFSNFCYVPSYKKHVLTIYVQENSIVKINCFTQNPIYIYLLNSEQKKIHDGYNHLYVESFTKGEYHVVFEFNLQSEKEASSFFYLQIYIYHFNLLERCAFDNPSEALSSSEELPLSSALRIDPLRSDPSQSNDVYDFSIYNEMSTAKDGIKVVDPTSFLFNDEHSYFFFKNMFIVIFSNKIISKKVILPRVATHLEASPFMLKIELIFHNNFLPLKLRVQDITNSLLYHSSYTYKNKIILTLTLSNGRVRVLNLLIDMYEDVSDSLKSNYCPYAYLHFVYTNEVEAYRKIGASGLSHGAIDLPLLLNSLLLRAVRGVDDKGEEIRINTSSDNVDSASTPPIEGGVTFRSPVFPVMVNQSVNYTIEMVNNDTMLFIADNDVFINIYLSKENGIVVLKMYHCLSTGILEKGSGIQYDEVHKNFLSISKEIASLSGKHVYLSTYLERGLYVLKFERDSSPIHVNVSVIWNSNREDPTIIGYVKRQEHANKLVNYASREVLPVMSMHRMNVSAQGTASATDISPAGDPILRKETHLFFGKELHCSGVKQVFRESKKVASVPFFFDEIVKTKLFAVYSGRTTHILVKKNADNMLIYERFYVCLGRETNGYYEQYSGEASRDESDQHNEGKYPLFGITVEDVAQIYVEIKPHYHFFIYPFELNVTSSSSYFSHSSGGKNFVSTNLGKGEYEIDLRFPEWTNNDIKSVMFDFVILLTFPIWEAYDTEVLSKKGTKMLLRDDTCNVSMYRSLFNKVDLINTTENDIIVSKNIISPKFKNKYFHVFDKYFIRDYQQEIFFTIPSGGYILKIFAVVDSEIGEGNDQGEGFPGESHPQGTGRVVDFPANYVNSFLNVRNVFNIRIVESDLNGLGGKNNNVEDKKEEISYVAPVYSNESEDYILVVYKVYTNFKMIIKTNNYDCNYFQLILNLHSVNSYSDVHHFSHAYNFNSYLKNIFDTLTVKAKLHDGINFEQKKLSTYNHVSITTSIVYLKNINPLELFSYPLSIKKGSYFKISVGYNFTQAHFEAKLGKNGEPICSGSKEKVNLKDDTINVFESISLFLDEGEYSLQILSHDLIEDSVNISKKFSFPFYLELDIFEFMHEKIENPILLDIFPHNSVPLDRNYPFFVDLIFWGELRGRAVYAEDGKQKRVQLRSGRMHTHGNVEIHKLILPPEEMDHMENNFVILFDAKESNQMNREKEKRLYFSFSTISTNVLSKNSSYEPIREKQNVMSESKEGNRQIHPESVNTSFLLEYGQRDAKRDDSIQENSNKDNFFDLDTVIRNYRLSQKKDKEYMPVSGEAPPKGESSTCIPLSIFALEIYCFEKNYFLLFLFVVFILCISCAFLFLLIKLWKNWTYYSSYDVITENEEEVTLFDDDI
ncbi:conserved Plasmodium protein, unknown function [Plasmodium ovale curtisi]|uniref:Uncharacterized protein n=1 Tax=Plasmodium ovale curtisi TaxID=864141 RepID=A0A1A8VPN9_PLAOA|nr:conserved Plasmodium protein, unknown function [Plasmodium ovale curtisi]